MFYVICMYIYIYVNRFLRVWMCLAKVNHGMYFRKIRRSEPKERIGWGSSDMMFFSYMTRFATSRLLNTFDRSHKVWHPSPNGECKFKFLSKSSWLKTWHTKSCQVFDRGDSFVCVFPCFGFRHPDIHVFWIVLLGKSFNLDVEDLGMFHPERPPCLH